MSIGSSGSSSDIAPVGSIEVTPSPKVSRSDEKERKLTPQEQEAKKQIAERRAFLNNICKISLRHSADARRRYDYEWMVRDLFRRGYQFSRYQPTTQTVVLASRQTARIPINIANAQMRSIRNQVTSFRPKFEVLPRYTSEESRVQARYAGKLLDYYFDHLNLKKKIKEIVTQGLMYSVGGPWQIIYDEDKEEVRIWTLDPFDFYFDPLAEELEDCEYVIKAVRRPVGEVIYNQEYDESARKEVRGGEARLAVSEYKQFMIQALKYVTQYNREEAPTLILFEGDFKIRDEDTGKIHIRKVVWTDQNFTPLLWEDTKEETYDYAIYQADLNPRDILGESWMKHVMPINRVINSLESSVYDYNYRVAKGRIVVDRDSGVRAIHNVHGEIISKNKGSEVRALDMPSLPVATSAQIERMYRYIEDIGGAHDASLGRVPAGVKSGIGIAELRQADATNQDDLVDNLEDFLSIVGQKILKIIAKNYTAIKVIKDLGYREQSAEYFAVVGSSSRVKGNKDMAGKEGKVKVGPDWLDLAIIGDDNNVRVTVGSWLGYTKEMMQEKTIKLLQLGAIDQKTFLRLWEFGDIDTIVQQTRIEALLKRQTEQGQQQGEVDQYGLALTENDMMINEFKNMPVDQHDDHIVHIALHQEVLGKGQDELVGKHIGIHQSYLNQGPTEVPAQEDQQRNQSIQSQQISTQTGMPTQGGQVMPTAPQGIPQGMPPMG